MSYIYKVTIEMQGEPTCEDKRRELFVEVDGVPMEVFAGHMARAANTRIESRGPWAGDPPTYIRANSVRVQVAGGHFMPVEGRVSE